MAGGGGKPTAVKAMTMMDKNKDRQISRNEFRGPPKRFKFLDTDGDGAISKDELEAGFGKPRARKNAPPKNPGQRLAARGQGRPENRKKFLSESEIRKTVIGNTLNFNAPLNGKNMFVYFAADGSVLFKVVGGGKIIRKNWFINEMSMLCRTFGPRNKNHCTKIKATGSPNQVTLFNKKVNYQAKLIKGKQLPK